jgi:hypothetical protein
MFRVRREEIALAHRAVSWLLDCNLNLRPLVRLSTTKQPTTIVGAGHPQDDHSRSPRLPGPPNPAVAEIRNDIRVS